MTHMQIFQAVAAGRMTAEQGASLMFENDRIERKRSMKAKAKKILNWLLFAACVAGATYVGFAAHGLGVAERIVLAGTSLGGLFVAMGSLLPRINKAIDDLPIDTDATPIVQPRNVAIVTQPDTTPTKPAA